MSLKLSIISLYKVQYHLSRNIFSHILSLHWALCLLHFSSWEAKYSCLSLLSSIHLWTLRRNMFLRRVRQRDRSALPLPQCLLHFPSQPLLILSQRPIAMQFLFRPLLPLKHLLLHSPLSALWSPLLPQPPGVAGTLTLLRLQPIFMTNMAVPHGVRFGRTHDRSLTISHPPASIVQLFRRHQCQVPNLSCRQEIILAQRTVTISPMALYMAWLDQLPRLKVLPATKEKRHPQQISSPKINPAKIMWQMRITTYTSRILSDWQL